MVSVRLRRISGYVQEWGQNSEGVGFSEIAVNCCLRPLSSQTTSELPVIRSRRRKQLAMPEVSKCKLAILGQQTKAAEGPLFYAKQSFAQPFGYPAKLQFAGVACPWPPQPYQYGVFIVHSDLGYFRCNRSNASRL